MQAALQDVVDGQREFDEAVKWEVKITGLPTFYADGKSKGEVKQSLRKMLKRPDDIISITRTSPAELKMIRRGQIAGKEPGEDEDVKEELLLELEDNRIIKVKNKELTNDDIVNMIQFGHPFNVVDEEIPPELPGPEVPRYKNVPNSVVDKADKKANKAKERAEKDILIPTQTQEGIVSGAGKVAGAALGGAIGLGINPALGALTGAGIIKKTSDIQKRLDQKKAKRKAEKEKKDPRLSHEVKVKKENYDMWFEASEWAQEKRKEKESSDRLLKIHKEREARYQKQQRKKREAQAKDKRDQDKAPVGKQHEGTDTWRPDDPEKDKQSTSYKHHVRQLPSTSKKPIKKSRKSNVDFKDLRPQYSSEDSQDLPGLGPSKKARRTSKRVGQLYTGAQVTGEAKIKHPDAGVPLSVRRARKKKSSTQMKKDMLHADQLSKIGKGRRKEQELQDVGVRPTPKWYTGEEKTPPRQVEVAPPGWGHTKAEKEKTKPNKPKSKIGGSAHEFQKDLDSGKFKGLPGDKTYKDRKASMFKLMWAGEKEGDEPHYKPGVKDVKKAKYKKDESVLDSAKRYLDNG